MSDKPQSPKPPVPKGPPVPVKKPHGGFKPPKVNQPKQFRRKM